MPDREDIKQIIDLLREKFPGAFPKGKFVVLKKGIDLDICKSVAVNISRTKLRNVLTVYTAHPGYIRSHIEGAKRYDLGGNIVGTVTAEEYSRYKEFQELRLQRKAFLKKARQAQRAFEDTDKDNCYTTTSENLQTRVGPRPKVIIRRKRIRTPSDYQGL